MKSQALICFLSFLWAIEGVALYNGTPALPDMPEDNLFLKEDSWFSLKTGGQVDWLVSRRVQVSSGQSPHMHSFLKGGEISFGFINKVELYTFLGAQNMALKAYKQGEFFSLKTTNSFGGEVGARATAIFWGETRLGFDAKYFYSWPQIESLVVEGVSRSVKTSTTWEQEWQVGVALSQRFAFFSPYIGVKYARMSLHFMGLSSLGGDIEVKNASPFGAFLGIGVAGQKGVFFDAEASFFDDYLFSGALGIRF